MSPQDIANLLTGLRYDTCDKRDSCEPCKGLRQESIAVIESLQKTVAELRAALHNASSRVIEQGTGVAHGVDFHALKRLASPPAAEEQKT